MQKLADLGDRLAMTKYRKCECRLGDEKVAAHELERRASRIDSWIGIFYNRRRRPRAARRTSTATCAEPRICPAGCSVIFAPAMLTLSPQAKACTVPAKFSP